MSAKSFFFLRLTIFLIDITFIASCYFCISSFSFVVSLHEFSATFEIVNTEEKQNKNKSPVIHIEHHLGLESWCVHHVYRHAHAIILAASKKHPKACGGDASSVDSHSGKCTTHQPFSSNLTKYLNCALLINPDVATFWNCRRRLFQKNRLQIRKEFQFTSIVLSKKPKSNDAFFYRRWLYSFQSHESIDWARELSLCERCASKTSSNYHAWCHRQWVLQKAPFLMQYELATTERFIRRHIADFNGYHHRQFVLRKLYELGYTQSVGASAKDVEKYETLIRFLKSRALIGDETTQSNLAEHLIDVILPKNSPSRGNAQLKTLLYCMDLAAHDLELVDELREMYGLREAFDCHRKATIQFMTEKCSEWMIPTDKKTPTNGEKSSTIMCNNGNIVTAIKRYEMDNGNEMHRKWCDIFL